MTIKYRCKSKNSLSNFAQPRHVSDEQKLSLKKRFIRKQSSLLTLINKGVVSKEEGRVALKLQGVIHHVSGSENVLSSIYKTEPSGFQGRGLNKFLHSKKADALLAFSLLMKRMEEIGANSTICMSVLGENESLREVDRKNQKRSGWARAGLKQGISCFETLIEDQVLL